MSTLSKSQLIEAFLEQLQSELGAIEASARAAHEAATHEESKSEDKHDTRGLEASYLAGAQAKRAAELKALIAAIRFLPARDFGPKDAIAIGALIELEGDGKRSHCFLIGQGGGVSVVFEGRTIQLITPHSPLGEELVGRRVGDCFEVEAQKSVREYEILSVR